MKNYRIEEHRTRFACRKAGWTIQAIAESFWVNFARPSLAVALGVALGFAAGAPVAWIIIRAI